MLDLLIPTLAKTSSAPPLSVNSLDTAGAKAFAGFYKAGVAMDNFSVNC